MSNIIGMVLATLKKEGIDTSNMDVNEAVAKYNEIKGTNDGQGVKGEETPKETQNTAEQGKETAKTSKEPEQAKSSTQSNYNLQDDVWNKQYCTEQLKNKSEEEQWQFITDIMQIRHDQYEDYKKKTGENITYKDFIATKGKLR